MNNFRQPLELLLRAARQATHDFATHYRGQSMEELQRVCDEATVVLRASLPESESEASPVSPPTEGPWYIEGPIKTYDGDMWQVTSTNEHQDTLKPFWTEISARAVRDALNSLGGQ